VFLLAQIEKAVPDDWAADRGRIRRIHFEGIGMATALGVTITDKETQAPAGC